MPTVWYIPNNVQYCFYFHLWTYATPRQLYQGDHSPDNMKFPDGSRHSSAALSMLSYSYQARTSVNVSDVGRNATVHDPKPYI